MIGMNESYCNIARLASNHVYFIDIIKIKLLTVTIIILSTQWSRTESIDVYKLIYNNIFYN